MSTWILTFPEKRRFVAVHQYLWDHVEVRHCVDLHCLEGAMFCYLLYDFLTQVTAQEV